MELYKDTANKLISYLIQHGYPKENLVSEWGNNQIRVDIAVVADDYTTPLSIFEIKAKKGQQAVALGINQLRRVVDQLKVSPQCFIVFPKEREPFFEAFDVSSSVYSNGNVEISTILKEQKVPIIRSFENINIGVKSKVIARQTEKKQ